MWSAGVILGQLLTGKQRLFRILKRAKTKSEHTEVDWTLLEAIIRFTGHLEESDLAELSRSLREPVSQISDCGSDWPESLTRSEPEGADLLRSMLRFDAKRRFSVSECLYHSYFNDCWHSIEETQQLLGDSRDSRVQFDYEAVLPKMSLQEMRALFEQQI